MTQEDLQHLALQEGKTQRELFLSMATSHPAKFTNPDEVAAEWRQRIARGETIPYVDQYLRRASGILS